MSKNIHDARSHCPAYALQKIGWQRQEITDLKAENARLRDGYDSLKCQYDEEHDELLRYKALAERCMEASQALLDALGQPRVASGLRHGRSEVMLRIGNLHAAINAAPEEAREKERR